MVLLGFGFSGMALTALAADPQQQSKRDTAIVAEELVVTVAAATPGAVTKAAEADKNEIRDLFVGTSIGSNEAYAATLHPKAISFVKDYLEDHEARLQKMKSWANHQFNLIDNILIRHSVPKELKYLAVIESNLNSKALSWAGAVGPWQFMPATARIFGLKVTKSRDERRDLYKSTTAAARYLKELYQQFGDWLLVIAAYNGGAARVESAIRRSHSRNFWDLQYYLPAESRNHVKKFIATHYIMEGKGGVTTTVAADMANLQKRPDIPNTQLQRISGKYLSDVVARYLEIDPAVFNSMNPGFDRSVSTDGYDMRLPDDKMAEFNEKKYMILNESVQQLLNRATTSATAERYPKELKLPAKQAKKTTRKK